MKQRGFTLIELLLYISMLGGLLIAVTAFYGLTNDSRVRSAVMGSVTSQGIFAMDYLTTTIRGATAMTAPAAGLTASSLTLTVPTGASSPTVFSLSSGTLMVKKGTAAATPLTSTNVTISNLTFTNLTRSGTNGVVQVSFLMTANNASGRPESTFSKTFTSSAEVSW